jgi:YVTN family beta-propeller protein
VSSTGARITVHFETRPAAVAVDDISYTVYVTSPALNSVAVIDGAARSVTKTILTGSQPVSITADESVLQTSSRSSMTVGENEDCVILLNRFEEFFQRILMLHI